MICVFGGGANPNLIQKSIDDIALAISTAVSLNAISGMIVEWGAGLIYSVLNSVNITADRAQAILYQMADDGYYDKILDIMTVNASDSTITVNGNFPASINRYKTLTVNNGVTFSGNALPGVLIADIISNDGTIKATATKGAAGAAGGDGVGVGGTGIGGLIILARTLTVGTIRSNGNNGVSGTTVTTDGNGGAGGAGLFWRIGADVVATGGNGGDTLAGGKGIGSQNAGGGGGGTGHIGGNGGVATIVDFATGMSLLVELIKTAADWWLQNVLSKIPTLVKSFPNLGGSGGGGGSAANLNGACGGGGGGGGQIIAVSTTLITGIFTAPGGNGGNGGTEGAGDSGGGGGAGGVIYVLYAVKIVTNASGVSGGAIGTSDVNAATVGGNGIFKEIII